MSVPATHLELDGAVGVCGMQRGVPQGVPVVIALYRVLQRGRTAVAVILPQVPAATSVTTERGVIGPPSL